MRAVFTYAPILRGDGLSYDLKGRSAHSKAISFHGFRIMAYLQVRDHFSNRPAHRPRSARGPVRLKGFALEAKRQTDDEAAPLVSLEWIPSMESLRKSASQLHEFVMPVSTSQQTANLGRFTRDSLGSRLRMRSGIPDTD